MKNEYIPYPAIIESIQPESFDTKTFRVKFKDKNLAEGFDYQAGQFAEVSLFGIGEVPISITSSPSRKGFLELSIRAAGKVTNEIHKLNIGDILFVRGPYGNKFPLEEIKNKNFVFIAGGIGLAPLRSVINQVFDTRKNFGRIQILYGAKTPDEFCFKEELKSWQKIPDTEVLLTVDNPTNGWRGNVGVVTTLWDKTKLDAKNTIAFVCGPPIMIKFVVAKLIATGFKDIDIFVTLERYMKCGIGKCGHCNMGEKFVCIDGPVFDAKQYMKLNKRI